MRWRKGGGMRRKILKRYAGPCLKLFQKRRKKHIAAKERV
jgi:hypothetical protein